MILLQEPNKNWGLIPKSDSFLDINATFDGILEQIISEKYDISPSSYNPTIERSYWVDFTLRLAFQKIFCHYEFLSI